MPFDVVNVLCVVLPGVKHVPVPFAFVHHLTKFCPAFMNVFAAAAAQIPLYVHEVLPGAVPLPPVPALYFTE
jgi:hypothetical protein